MAVDAFWKAAFSSESEQWDTPPELVAAMAPWFQWDLDVCASGPNVCPTYYTPEQDGLEQPWLGLCWMNPPYGREIGKWMEKAAYSAAKAVVCLVPVRSDARWWQYNVIHSSFVVNIKGRLAFGSDAYWEGRWSVPKLQNGKKNNLYGKWGQKQSAPFPSAFVVFGSLTGEQQGFLASHGIVAQYSRR